ncbi:MAG: polyprenol phosphomannose-dependent alpha 1,6 mannosyltransferase MptB [Acidimicrobiales bacterium]
MAPASGRAAPESAGASPPSVEGPPEAPVAGADRALHQVPLTVAGTSGFVGTLFVLIGVAQSGSPFAAKLSGAWFFGVGGGASVGGQDATFVGIIVLDLGVVLMIGSWYELVRTLRRDPRTSVKKVMAIIAAWAVPVLVMPPMFSRDVYSYAAQGEMVSKGLNPYVHGPGALGRNPFLRLVDPVWTDARAPYGPAWERLSGGIVQVARHDVLASVVGFRLVAAAGIALIAWGVPALARSVGRDPATALALAVLNPLVLLVLLGGAHNDALMLGLLVAACALARRNHVLVGLALCALAAEVKVPALIGALFIGWWWSDGSSSWRRRACRVVGAVLIAVGLMAGIGVVAGLGWRWLDGLGDPGVVVSWVDPATAVGLALGHASAALGLGGHTAAYVRSARAVGLALAAATSVGLLLRSRVGDVQALGWSLLAFVVLGPVVWPWYETWGFVLLAVVAEGWTLRLLLALSAVGCFADLPSARYYETGPALAIAGWALLAGLILTYGVLRLLPSVRRPPRPDVDPSTPRPTRKRVATG